MRYYSVYDKTVKAFMPLFPARADGEAIRMMTDTLSDSTSMLAKHPMDFELFLVAVFDDQEGVLRQDFGPVKIIGVGQLVDMEKGG